MKYLSFFFISLIALSQAKRNFPCPAGGCQFTGGPSTFVGPLNAGSATFSGTVNVGTTAINSTTGVTGPFYKFGSGSGAPVWLRGTTGVNGQRFSFESSTTTGSAELQLIPGASVSGIATQIQWFGKTGNDYERFVITAIDGTYILDTTSDSAGIPRNIYFQAGGHSHVNDGGAGTPINGQNALIINGVDGSVDVIGSTFVANGNTFGTTTFRVSDYANNGAAKMFISARTGTPSSVTTDQAYVIYQRGGVSKWYVGLNGCSTNTDSFGYYVPGTGCAFEVGPSGTLRLSPAGDTGLTLEAGGAANQSTVSFRRAGANKWLVYVPGSSSDLRFYDGTADRMILAAGGDLTLSAPGNGAGSVVTTSATQTLSAKTFVAPVLGVASATTIKVTATTVSGLPTCNGGAEGTRSAVTDAAASPVYNATVASGGSVRIPVYCDGTNWKNN